MWLMLICGFDGCGGIDDIEMARAADWQAEAAIIGFVDPEYPNLRHEWHSVEIDGVAKDARFRTQRECLRALRRAMPEGQSSEGYAGDWSLGWEEENVIHGPDYVERFAAVGRAEQTNMMRTYFFGCFREEPRTG